MEKASDFSNFDQNSVQNLKVYYDGLCVLCAQEVGHYMKQEGAEKIDFIDITEDSFDSEEQGLDPRLVHKYMHVRTSDGETKTKIDAFFEIWKVLPKYRFLVKALDRFPIKPILLAGYHLFAEVRPFLPKRSKRLCETSPYCDLK